MTVIEEENRFHLKKTNNRLKDFNLTEKITIKATQFKYSRI